MNKVRLIKHIIPNKNYFYYNSLHGMEELIDLDKISCDTCGKLIKRKNGISIGYIDDWCKKIKDEDSGEYEGDEEHVSRRIIVCDIHTDRENMKALQIKPLYYKEDGSFWKMDNPLKIRGCNYLYMD